MRQFLASLLLLPLQALAAVAIVNTPSTINDAANYTAESGGSLAVAICIRGEVAAGTTTLDVSDISFGAKTLGGGQITLGAKINNTADWTREFVGIYYVKEANIPAGANAITVTWNQAVAGTTSEITAYTLSGVNQTTAVDTTTTARYPASGSTGTTDHFTASAPTVANNTVQIHCAAWNATATTGTVKGTGWGEDADAAGSGVRVYADSKTTSTGGALDFWGATLSGGTQGLGVVVSFAPSVTPTFTSAPAIGTRTTGSIPINATSDTTGTMYGARLTDGSGTPTCDQLEAQTATGGVQYASEAVVATVADTLTFGSITDGTLTDGYFCIEDSSGNDSAVASIADMYKLPAFTTALTIASQTDTTYTTNSKVLDGPGTVDLVACAKDASPPSVSQVEARTGGCIINGSTDDATGTMTLDPSGAAFPVYDLYYVGSYGSQHEAAVHALADECLDAPSGKQIINCPNGFTSIGAGGAIAGLNAVITPDIAVGDIATVDLATTPEGCQVTMSVAGLISLAGPGGVGSCSGARQYVNATFYDLSVSAIHADDLDWWLNDPAIVPPAPNSLIFYIPLNSAMTPINLSQAGYCFHPLGDHITYSAVDALPAGLSITDVGGDSTLGGTATVRALNLGKTWRCTSDITGGSVDWQ